MRIEIKETGNEAFYKEFVNVFGQYRNLMKNPEMKLKDHFKSLRSYIMILVGMFVILTLSNMYLGFDFLGIFSMVVLAVVAVLCAVVLKNFNNIYQSYLNDPRTSVVTVDETGVELNKEDSQVVKLGWENIAFARRFDESLCFLPKDNTGLIIAIPKKYEEQIKDEIQCQIYG